MLEHELTTPGPLSVCLEKLRGFVADHGANILAAEGDTIELKISGTPAACRRQDDRSYSFKTVLRFTEVRRTSERPDVQLDERPAQIRISVMIMSRDVTDRRRTAQTDHAMAMLSSLQAYLMARRNEYGPADSEPGETRSVTLPSFM